MGRKGKASRKTKETEITVELDLDGSGKSEIQTGIPFFNHMLEIFARHGLFDLKLIAKGDLEVDYHHTVEDVGLVLGQAFKQALGEKQGIRRFGEATIPLDEALAQAVVDLSGRPYLCYNAKVRPGKVGSFDTDLPQEFFRALANQVGMNLHVNVYQGENPHHIIEACFKAAARAMEGATRTDPRIQGVLSTKGTL